MSPTQPTLRFQVPSMIHDQNVSQTPWATRNAATFLKFLSRHRAPCHICRVIQGCRIKVFVEIRNGPHIINTAPIPIPDASHSTSKALVKSGKAKKGVEQSLSFNKLKALSCSSFHLNPIDLFTISVKGAAIVPKSFTNLL